MGSSLMGRQLVSGASMSTHPPFISSTSPCSSFPSASPSWRCLSPCPRRGGDPSSFPPLSSLLEVPPCGHACPCTSRLHQPLSHRGDDLSAGELACLLQVCPRVLPEQLGHADHVAVGALADACLLRHGERLSRDGHLRHPGDIPGGTGGTWRLLRRG